MNALHIAHKGADKNDGLIIVRTNYNNAGGYDSLTISNSDYLGGIGFDSQDGNIPSSILEASAFIAAYAAEDHSTGDKGGDLVFGTTAIDDDDDTVSHEKMRIRSNGEVIVQSDIITSGSLKGTAFQTYSSARFKNNITEIKDPIQVLSGLKGVYFDWIEERGGNRDIGFIAEEVGQVIPEIVTYESDNTNAISMSYDKIVPLLVEAFNESRKREKKNKKIFWAVTILNLALVSLGTIFL
ncbi:MAG: tail fiber domain-containing protein [Actinomycetota bacterium]|nr:tail fiber domain-containing protein [Actinomycetota bacterium]